MLNAILESAVIPALQLLPGNMDTPAARVMLLAIGLQESRFTERRQLVGSPPRPVGPAKSFWQGEEGGGMVKGVRTHAATKDIAAQLYRAREVVPTNREIWHAIEHDDVLAAALARLLLWTDPLPLPKVGAEEDAWALYLRTWRPGAYARGTPTKRADLRAKWGRNYALAVDEVAR